MGTLHLKSVNRPLAPTSFLILLILLLPSLLFLKRFEDLPQFGELHDDSIYYTGAKTLAQGRGYLLESLPGSPAQTKFPPLYPLLLSLAWKLNPHFDENLTAAAWISWLAWPALLIVLLLYLPRMGLSGARLWIAMTLVAVNPFCLLFSGRLISELLFTVFLIATLLLVEDALEKGAAVATAAGTVAGLCYLTRSAGIVLLASATLYFWFKNKRTHAIFFAFGMLPFILAWTIWSRVNQFPTKDPDIVYYTNYLAGYLNNISLNDLPLFVWRNLDQLLTALGSLVLPQVLGVGILKILADVIAIAMIVGIVRLVRSGLCVHYALFAAGSAVLLLIWHFPPNERLVLPLYPLALAGLLAELAHFWSLMRGGLSSSDMGQRVVAGLMATVVGLIFAGALVLQFFTAATLLPGSAAAQRHLNVPNQAAYAWVRLNTPPEAQFFAFFDPLFYLHTGRHAMSRPLPPALWYHEDREGILKHYEDLVPYAKAHGLGYLLINDQDFRREMSDEDRAALEKSIRENPQLERVWMRETSAIYRVLP
jgi:hypothetical protein